MISEVAHAILLSVPWGLEYLERSNNKAISSINGMSK
jgi:hypothetical protein